MAIKTITPLPNNEPDAVPSLWNSRYTEIDNNFTELDNRTKSNEDELSSARGGKPSVGARLSEMSTKIEASSPEFQDQLAAAVLAAMDQASVANQSIKDLKGLSQQEGIVTIKNRGVVSGCVASKSDNATRNLNFSGGIVLMGGRKHVAPAADNAASVPPNTTVASVVVRAYLYMHSASQTMRLAVTNVGQPMPTDAIHLYNITIPAGSTDSTDPKLVSSTISSVKRVEPMFPRSLSSPVTKSIQINKLRDTEYRVDVDVVSFDGGSCDIDHVAIQSRATNGFSIHLASEADNVCLRWRVSKLDN